MSQRSVFCAGKTPAAKYARQHLMEYGVPTVDNPEWDTDNLLLDVPSFQRGLWTDEALDTLLASLPGNVTIWGGNLDHPSLEGYFRIDMLQDETYLVKNADITADCAIPIAQSFLKQPWVQSPTLIIGYGRIGKALAHKLHHLDCPVTIASGSNRKRAELGSSGFACVDSADLPRELTSYKLIINTAPARMLTAETLSTYRDCVKLDLASRKGLESPDVIWARGLPGKYAPEQSGKLIADTFLRLSGEVCQ